MGPHLPPLGLTCPHPNAGIPTRENVRLHSLRTTHRCPKTEPPPLRRIVTSPVTLLRAVCGQEPTELKGIAMGRHIVIGLLPESFLSSFPSDGQRLIRVPALFEINLLPSGSRLQLPHERHPRTAAFHIFKLPALTQKVGSISV